jgi:hypothetical protein
MPRTGLAYERPSRVSQVLVIGFSVAVVAMAGWLVTMLMVSGDGNTMAADRSDQQVAAAPQAALVAPRTQLAAPEPIRLGSLAVATPAAPPPMSASGPQTTPWPSAPFAVRRPPEAAPIPAPQVAAAAAPTYTTSSVPTVGPDSIERGMTGDDRVPLTEATAETPEASQEVIPLPPPKPRRVASVPVPRPRPHLDSDDAQPQERSFFDFLVNRQR